MCISELTADSPSVLLIFAQRTKSPSGMLSISDGGITAYTMAAAEKTISSAAENRE